MKEKELRVLLMLTIAVTSVEISSSLDQFLDHSCQSCLGGYVQWPARRESGEGDSHMIHTTNHR